MTSWAQPRSARVAPTFATASRPLAPLGLRLLTFFVAGATASLAYATLLRHPPVLRVLALAAIATAYGAAIRASGERRSSLPAVRVALPVLATALALALAFIALGVPARLIAPWHWGALVRALEGGLHGLRSWAWPYIGAAHWARVDVLLPLAPCLTLMALLYFWPAERAAGARRVWALAIAVALAVCGMANAPTGAWRAQGVLLVVLVFAWLWLPQLRGVDAGRALGWTVACAIPALIAAPLLSGGSAWIPFTSTRAAAATAFQWDQLYGPIDWSRSNDAMFTVTAANPGLVHVTSLDRFDGLRFIRSSAPPETVPEDLDIAEHKRTWLTQATITVGALRSNLLVGGDGLTVQVRWPQNGSPAALSREHDGTVLLSSPLQPGTRYSVISYSPKPTIAQMQAAPATLPAVYQPYTQFQLPAPAASGLRAVDLTSDAAAAPPRALVVQAPRWNSGAAADARIVASPYGPMYLLARRLAAGAGSTYEVAERIERFLQSNYRYDEHPPQRRYPLEAFLFRDRRGYCEQFSGAMTLMLRMDGIPARVGVGFKPLLLDPATSTWTVRAFDAHAWTEVFFAGIGWVSFDPTPAPRGRAATAATSTTSKGALLGTGARKRQSSSGAGAAQRHRARGARGGGESTLWLALGCALAALALLVLPLLLLRRRRLGPRATAPPHAARRDAVAELERALARLGFPHAPGTTLTQLAARLERAGQREAAAYVTLLRDLRYRPPRELEAELRAAARAKRPAMRRALAFGHGLRGRLRALVALPPRLPRLR